MTGCCWEQSPKLKIRPKHPTRNKKVDLLVGEEWQPPNRDIFCLLHLWPHITKPFLGLRPAWIDWGGYDQSLSHVPENHFLAPEFACSTWEKLHRNSQHDILSHISWLPHLTLLEAPNPTTLVFASISSLLFSHRHIFFRSLSWPAFFLFWTFYF